MTDIKPALTKEEWEERQDARAEDLLHSRFRDANGAPYRNGKDGVSFIEDGTVRVFYDSMVVSQEIPEDERHATAALCLHDQEYGFTWEDVDRLDRMYEDYGGDWLLSHKAKIVALLPPRE